MRSGMSLSGLLLCGMLSGAGGCANGPRGHGEVSPIEPRVDAFAGRTLVMPVELSGPIDPGSPVEARLDGGPPLKAGLYWISVGPDESPDPRPWLAPAGRWYATPASAASRPSATGVWAVVIDLPPDAAGRGLWLDGKRVGLNWVADPDGSDSRAPVARYAEDPGSPWLGQLLAPERTSPPRRWRWRLIAHGLGSGIGTPDSERFADPVLEALAEQGEARWGAGLQRLASEDAGLAAELEWRLGEMVDFGGTVAPVWAAGDHELESLLGDLLNTGLGADRRAERVRAWLAARPAAVAWVADDAGRRDEITDKSVATIGIANLLPTGVLAGLLPDDGSLPGELSPLAPAGTVMLSTALTPPADSLDPGASVRVRAGGWERTSTVMAARAPARPPGLRIGPLHSDWTMATWEAGVPATAADDSAAAALLLMKEGVADAAGWTLYVESWRDPAAGAEDVLRVWLGPFGAPKAILRVSSDGLIIEEGAAGTRTRDPARTPVTRQADGRWSCRLAIPAASIEPDGTLRIGVERVDASGRRSAWPRPMLPWQVEPGRLAVATTLWGDLGGAQPGH